MVPYKSIESFLHGIHLTIVNEVRKSSCGRGPSVTKGFTREGAKIFHAETRRRGVGKLFHADAKGTTLFIVQGVPKGHEILSRKVGGGTASRGCKPTPRLFIVSGCPEGT